MRRLLLAAVLTAAACGGDAHEGDPAIAAEAAGQRLTSAQLGKFLTKAQPGALNVPLAGFVARVWVDYTLLSQTIVKGESLTDAAALANALAVPILEARTRFWHDLLAARRPALDSTLADSAYTEDSIRVLQHILLPLRPNLSARERDQLRRKVDSLAAAARAGADFAALARRESKDTSTAAGGGYLPARPRGAWVQPLDNVGWALQPGEVSNPVISPFGVHILRRPKVEEVRGRLMVWVRARHAARLDRLYVDSLMHANAVAVAGFAPDTIRAIASWRTPPTGSATALVTTRAGNLTRDGVEQLLATLPAETLEQLAQSSDSQVTLLARDLAATMLLQKQAEAAGIRLTEAQRQRLATYYAGELDQILDLADFRDPGLTDPARPLSERAALAAQKTMHVVTLFVEGQRRYRPMQPGLAASLRLHNPHLLSPAGIRHAVEVARNAQRTAAPDSAAR